MDQEIMRIINRDGFVHIDTIARETSLDKNTIIRFVQSNYPWLDISGDWIILLGEQRFITN